MSRSRNPEHWRARAEEARTVAESLGDMDCRRMMLQVAEDYEKLARRAEELAQRPEKKEKPRGSALALNDTPATSGVIGS